MLFVCPDHIGKVRMLFNDLYPLASDSHLKILWMIDFNTCFAWLIISAIFWTPFNSIQSTQKFAFSYQHLFFVHSMSFNFSIFCRMISSLNILQVAFIFVATSIFATHTKSMKKTAPAMPSPSLMDWHRLWISPLKFLIQQAITQTSSTSSSHTA